MQVMSVFRAWQMKAMQKNLLTIEHVVTSISDPAVFNRRDNGDGWTIAEVLGHLADFDAIFHERARRVVETDNPPAPFPDPNALVIEKGYAQQDVLAVLKQWKSQRVSYHDYLTSLPGGDEDLWERPHHIKRGGFTLNDQLMLTAYHDSDHLHQIVKIIRA